MSERVTPTPLNRGDPSLSLPPTRSEESRSTSSDELGEGAWRSSVSPVKAVSSERGIAIGSRTDASKLGRAPSPKGASGVGVRWGRTGPIKGTGNVREVEAAGSTTTGSSGGIGIPVGSANLASSNFSYVTPPRGFDALRR